MIKTREKPGAKSLEASSESPDSSKQSGILKSSGLAVAKTSGEGVVVTEVEPGSPAAQAGINKGDVILEVNRTSVKSPETLGQLLADKNKSYLLRVERTDPAGEMLYAVTILDLKNSA